MIQLRNLSQRLVWSLDFLVLFTLAFTGEIHHYIFLICAVILLLNFFVKGRLPNWGLVTLLVGILSGCFFLWLKFQVPLIVAVAHGAPLIHALLWLSPPQNRERLLRLGIGFVELNVISVISSELFVSGTIFLFAVMASVLISCNYLEVEFKRYAENQSVPKTFLKNSIGISFIALLSSLVIFPILPRHEGTIAQSLSTLNTGYTEEVVLTNPNSVLGQGGGATIMRIYPVHSSDEDLLMGFHMGLLRGKVLSKFDGTTWTSGVKRRSRKLDLSALEMNKKSSHKTEFEVIREPVKSNVFFIPYMTGKVLSIDSSGVYFPAAMTSAERFDPKRGTQRTTYRFSVDFNANYQEYLDTDVELDHSYVPDNIITDRLRNLANRIFRNAKTPAEKIINLRNFFIVENFKPLGNGTKEQDASLDPLRQKFNPLEQFLFLDKIGHCELYASAMALLLRVGGVPTRLVSGFRITRGPVGGALSVRMGDAHAWLEAWVSGKGWIVLDPTPKILVIPNLLEAFRETYEWMSANWYRYIVSFDSKKQLEVGSQAIQFLTNPSKGQFDLKSQLSLKLPTEQIFGFVGIGLLGVLIIFGGILLIRFYRYATSFGKQLDRKSVFQLIWERYKFDRFCHQILKQKKVPKNPSDREILEHFLHLYGPDSVTFQSLNRWFDSYYDVRFGKSTQLEAISQSFNHLKRDLKKSA